MTICIQFMSDLHLETPKAYDVFKVQPAAPYLALLGDIGYTCHDELFEFLRAQLSQFELVFFLLGNHEPYESGWDEAVRRTEEFRSQIESDPTLTGNFIFLNQTRYRLSDNLTILGCTLFSRITDEQYDHVSFGLNDFYRIEDWTVEAHNIRHEADLAWLNDQVSEIQRSDPDHQIVIFTHHSPTIDDRTISPKNATSKMSSGFMTDLGSEPCWQSKNVSVWAFGHSHYNCDVSDSGTGKRLVTNQRGYYFAQAQDFAETKVLHLT